MGASIKRKINVPPLVPVKGGAEAQGKRKWVGEAHRRHPIVFGQMLAQQVDAFVDSQWELTCRPIRGEVLGKAGNDQVTERFGVDAPGGVERRPPSQVP